MLRGYLKTQRCKRDKKFEVTDRKFDEAATNTFIAHEHETVWYNYNLRADNHHIDKFRTNLTKRKQQI